MSRICGGVGLENLLTVYTVKYQLSTAKPMQLRAGTEGMTLPLHKDIMKKEVKDNIVKYTKIAGLATALWTFGVTTGVAWVSKNEFNLWISTVFASTLEEVALNTKSRNIDRFYVLADIYKNQKNTLSQEQLKDLREEICGLAKELRYPHELCINGAIV